MSGRPTEPAATVAVGAAPLSRATPAATPAAVVRAALDGSRDGEASFRVRGGSMWPFLRDGALVRVRRRRGPFAVGEVVLRATSDGALLAHRVVARAAGRLDTRGDARDATDGWIADADVLAVMVSPPERARWLIARALAPSLRAARHLARALGLRRRRAAAPAGRPRDP